MNFRLSRVNSVNFIYFLLITYECKFLFVTLLVVMSWNRSFRHNIVDNYLVLFLTPPRFKIQILVHIMSGDVVIFKDFRLERWKYFKTISQFISKFFISLGSRDKKYFVAFSIFPKTKLNIFALHERRRYFRLNAKKNNFLDELAH